MRALLPILLLAAGPAAAQPASDSTPNTRLVQVGAHLVRVQTFGLEQRTPGTPVVVLEAGATNALEVWRSVVPALASRAAVVAYDRAGLGRSAWDSVTPTPRHATARLFALLEGLGAPPPWLLVGYSWGGMLMRYFAGYYPETVAGLVLVDPAPVLTLTPAELIAPFDSVGAGRPGFEAYWSAFAGLFRQFPPAVRAEFAVFRNLQDLDPAQRDLRPAPAVPLTILVAGKYLPLPPGLGLSFDPETHFQVDLRARVRELQEWVAASPRGTLVLASHLTHAIPREDPGLIVRAITDLLAARGR
jgi:pimeloyl-ACP methyl ester carboxylesterase